MDFDVQIARSVREIGQETWDRLGADVPFASYRWCLFGEQVLRDPPVYINLYFKGEPAARAVFCLYRQDIHYSRSILVGLAAKILTEAWPPLVCQMPIADVCGLIIPSDLRHRAEALRTIIEAAKEEARKQRSSFLIFDRLEASQLGWEGWPASFSRLSFEDPDTRLEVCWKDFDEYIRHLSPKTRKNYRRICRSGEANRVRIRYSREVIGTEEARQLMANVERRHRDHHPYWRDPVLEHAGMVDSTWITADVDGRLVGCELVLSDRGASFVTALGIDHAIPNVYFLLGYADIRLAIERGDRTLSWGSQAYETKGRFGFEKAENRHTLFWGVSPLLHRIGRWLGGSS